MLILSRKTNESIVIDGRIVVKIVRVEGDVVKVGVSAPAEVPVHRQEVYEEIQRSNQEALTNRRPAVPKLPLKPHRTDQPTIQPMVPAVISVAGDSVQQSKNNHHKQNL
ncbi:MAG: carbon storage regulator CsrA [Verrucomicrobia bacterium]|nr:carbon storage regulator CsrA [Verrucomicrobiota bacterium]